jgi:hypothetical protein
MADNDYSIENSIMVKKYGDHVKINMGSTYCIISCSIHKLSEFVEVVDSMCSERWVATSGITSDDGMVFQSMSRMSLNNSQSNSN